jgi:hypothetical protein
MNSETYSSAIFEAALAALVANNQLENCKRSEHYLCRMQWGNDWWSEDKCNRQHLAKTAIKDAIRKNPAHKSAAVASTATRKPPPSCNPCFATQNPTGIAKKPRIATNARSKQAAAANRATTAAAAQRLQVETTKYAAAKAALQQAKDEHCKANAAAANAAATASQAEQSLESHALVCPITYEIMKNPVHASDGNTYEEEALENWFRRSHGRLSPLTRQLITHWIPNRAIENVIAEVTLKAKGLQNAAAAAAVAAINAACAVDLRRSEALAAQTPAVAATFTLAEAADARAM